MSGALVRHTAGGQLVTRRTTRALRDIGSETQLEQACMRAMSVTAEYALSEVEYLKRLQNRIESDTPDAAEAVAAIVNTAILGIAGRVNRFSQEIDW